MSVKLCIGNFLRVAFDKLILEHNRTSTALSVLSGEIVPQRKTLIFIETTK